MKKKSYVFAGASQRGLHMFMEHMKAEFGDYCDLLGVYDINPGRAQEVGGRVGVPVFNDFDAMVKETNPDIIVVTTIDAFHSDYIIRGLELGCDVITEKPMTIDAARCNAILEAEKRTGKKVIVTFNYRYAPFNTKIKELVAGGAIGDVFSVHFEWMLDRNIDILAHGTSYFRRWNARMKNSGGLLVHKATHHFDLVNWYLGQRPQSVSAFGKLNLYGTPGSQKYAGGISGKNCRNCAHTKECVFKYTLNEEEISLFTDNEKYDGYYKDGCVYAPDIDIYDTMAVTVKYDKGALLNYSLNATCAYEGWRITINGSKGRLEASMAQSGQQRSEVNTIKVFDLKNNISEHHIARAEGGHDGGDTRLHHDLFIGDRPDVLGHKAGTTDGASSIIIGAAANISIKEGRVVNIDELIKF